MLRRLLWAAAASAILAGCRGRAGPGRRLPSAITIQLSAPPARVDPPLAARLSAIGAASFFVPAIEGSAVGESAVFAAVASRDPGSLAGDVYWEVTGRGDFDGPLHRDPKKVAAELLRVLDPMVRRSPNRIAGIHLSWRVRDASDGYALVLQSIRRRIPAGWTLSAAVEGRLPEAARNRWKSAARKTDFLVADVFGRREDVDPAGFRLGASLDDLVDLGVPVYAGFAPQGRGVVVLPGRPPGPALPDGAVDGLSKDRRFDFSFGDVLSDPDEDVYVFTAKEGARLPRERTVPAGTTATFREKRVSDFVHSLADARAAPGKVIRLAGLDDETRLFTLRTLEDVLLGRALAPRLSFALRQESGGVSFVAVNSAPEWSSLSRLNNWIDVRIPGARILDLRPGQFDRFAFLDERGRPVAAARARSIRLFENFVAPGETISTGPIRLAGASAIFASAHLTLPDGKVATVAESRAEGAAVPGASSGVEERANGVERGARGKGQSVERKPHRH